MDGKSVGGHKIYQNCQTYKFIFGRVSVLRGLCNLYKMEGIFFKAHCIVKTAKLYHFFLEGVRFEGTVLQGYNGEIFSAARLPSDSPNF